MPPFGPNQLDTIMDNRLSKIAIRTGDDGSRTDKDSVRIQAIGDIDEPNSQLGLLLCENLDVALREPLLSIQHDLFDLGDELCIPGYALVTDTHVERLDRLLEKYNTGLPPLKEFILPGGNNTAALAHVCRRAERSIVSLRRDEIVNESVRQYMNRLSDLLFVLSRVLNRADSGSDVLWQKDGAPNNKKRARCAALEMPHQPARDAADACVCGAYLLVYRARSAHTPNGYGSIRSSRLRVHTPVRAARCSRPPPRRVPDLRQISDFHKPAR